MEVRGRLDKAASQVTRHARRPIILPRKHRITSLVIAAEDEKCHHEFGIKYALANIIQRYWIVGGKQAIKSYRQRCNMCKLKWNKPATQLMGQLPQVRVAITERAFPTSEWITLGHSLPEKVVGGLVPSAISAFSLAWKRERVIWRWLMT
eukprot:scpid76222/ scgid30480/ 